MRIAGQRAGVVILTALVGVISSVLPVYAVESAGYEDQLLLEAPLFTGEEGGISVEIRADGDVFPDGTQMEMRALSNEETAGIAAASQELSGSSHGVGDCFGFDITFTGPDGLEVEPSRQVLVGVSSEWIEDYEDMVLAYQDEEQTVGYLELLDTDMRGLYFYADTFTSFAAYRERTEEAAESNSDLETESEESSDEDTEQAESGNDMPISEEGDTLTIIEEGEPVETGTEDTSETMPEGETVPEEGTEPVPSSEGGDETAIGADPEQTSENDSEDKPEDEADGEENKEPADENEASDPAETESEKADEQDTEKEVTEKDKISGKTGTSGKAGSEKPATSKTQNRVPSGSVQEGTNSRAAISVSKKANVSKISNAKPGDMIQYTFIITNTGSDTLHDVVLKDTMKGLSKITYHWEDSTDPSTGSGILSPGERVTAEASYMITDEDIKAGKVVNTASAIAWTPDGQAVSSGKPEASTEISDEKIRPKTGDSAEMLLRVFTALFAVGGAAGIACYENRSRKNCK